jgi:hypothetical protein
VLVNKNGVCAGVCICAGNTVANKIATIARNRILHSAEDTDNDAESWA